MLGGAATLPAGPWFARLAWWSRRGRRRDAHGGRAPRDPARLGRWRGRPGARAVAGEALVSQAPGPARIPAAVADARQGARRAAEAWRSSRMGAVVAGIGVAALFMVAFIVLDYTFDQDPHRIFKVAVGLLALAAIMARPRVGLLILPVVTPFLPWVPPTPVPGLNALNVLLLAIFGTFALGRTLRHERLFRPNAPRRAHRLAVAAVRRVHRSRRRLPDRLRLRCVPGRAGAVPLGDDVRDLLHRAGDGERRARAPPHAVGASRRPGPRVRGHHRVRPLRPRRARDRLDRAIQRTGIVRRAARRGRVRHGARDSQLGRKAAALGNDVPGIAGADLLALARRDGGVPDQRLLRRVEIVPGPLRRARAGPRAVPRVGPRLPEDAHHEFPGGGRRQRRGGARQGFRGAARDVAGLLLVGEARTRSTGSGSPGWGTCCPTSATLWDWPT